MAKFQKLPKNLVLPPLLLLPTTNKNVQHNWVHPIRSGSSALFSNFNPSKTPNHPVQPRFGLANLFPLPHLQHLTVTIRVDITGEGRATSRPVLREKPARLEPNAACITQRFRTKRTSSPLWSLLNLAMTTPPLKLSPN